MTGRQGSYSVLPSLGMRRHGATVPERLWLYRQQQANFDQVVGSNESQRLFVVFWTNFEHDSRWDLRCCARENIHPE